MSLQCYIYCNTSTFDRSIQNRVFSTWLNRSVKIKFNLFNLLMSVTVIDGEGKVKYRGFKLGIALYIYLCQLHLFKAKFSGQWNDLYLPLRCSDNTKISKYIRPWLDREDNFYSYKLEWVSICVSCTYSSHHCISLVS